MLQSSAKKVAYAVLKSLKDSKNPLKTYLVTRAVDLLFSVRSVSTVQQNATVSFLQNQEYVKSFSKHEVVQK